MFYKSRTESPELQLLRFLNYRMPLADVNQTYYNLNKGYEGEVLFDTWLGRLKIPCLVLNDLRLKVNNHFFQIDSLLILSNEVHIFEVKNYEGDYFYEDNRIFPTNKSKNEISNPLLQLERAHSLLRQLLHKFDVSISIQSSVIFINPEFMLYQAPLDKPFLFSTQLNRFMTKLTSSRLNEKHHNLAATLVSLNTNENPYKRLPPYQLQDLRKGITCAVCQSFGVEIQRHKCICTNCKNEEKVVAAVLRSVEEFKLLFPNEKITTSLIFDWCKIVDSQKRIQRVLDNCYTKVGVHQWQYYV